MKVDHSSLENWAHASSLREARKSLDLSIVAWALSAGNFSEQYRKMVDQYSGYGVAELQDAAVGVYAFAEMARASGKIVSDTIETFATTLDAIEQERAETVAIAQAYNSGLPVNPYYRYTLDRNSEHAYPNVMRHEILVMLDEPVTNPYPPMKLGYHGEYLPQMISPDGAQNNAARRLLESSPATSSVRSALSYQEVVDRVAASRAKYDEAVDAVVSGFQSASKATPEFAAEFGAPITVWGNEILEGAIGTLDSEELFALPKWLRTLSSKINKGATTLDFTFEWGARMRKEELWVASQHPEWDAGTKVREAIVPKLEQFPVDVIEGFLSGILNDIKS